MTELDFRSYISTLKERDLYDEYVIEVQRNLSRLPEDRIELVIGVLVFGGGLASNEHSPLTMLSANDISVYMIKDLLFKMSDENKRYNFISKN
jgi:hypothetical protein